MCLMARKEFPGDKGGFMWWLVGLAIYLFLLLVASLFMYGASRLQDEIPHPRGPSGKSLRERKSKRAAPQQLPLPFTPSR